MTPVLSMPWLRIITDAMATTALEANPEMASRGAIRPSQARARLARTAARSSRTRLLMKRMMVMAITIPSIRTPLSIKALVEMAFKKR